VGWALILDRCRASDLFASVDAHLWLVLTRGMMQGRKKGWGVEQCCVSGSVCFSAIPHPDRNPVVGDTDPAPDPSIIKQKVRKTLIPSVL
jgi:hypothetical protein